MSNYKKDDNHERIKTEIIDDYAKGFITQLKNQNYSQVTIKGYSYSVNIFCQKIKERKINIKKLNNELAVDLLNNQKLSLSRKKFHIFISKKFIKYLTDLKVINPLKLSINNDNPYSHIKQEYEDYLRHQRGLSKSTIRTSWRIAKRFLQFQFKKDVGDLSKITQKDVIKFMQKLIIRKKPLRNTRTSSHVKSFFQFLFQSGKTTINLSLSIPRVAHKYLARLPRYLTPDHVETLIASISKDTLTGRRDYAMILLLARLGLRATEIIAIKIDDIDWRLGELLIRGKGKIHDRLPLPKDVGKAIVDYIQRDRITTSRFLFVSYKAPNKPFVDGQILNTVLKKAFAKTNLKPPTRYVGSHILRHSLATNMIRKGASLEEIGNVLRHRSRQTTMIYAKLDLESLRSIACSWPIEGGVK